METTPEKPGTHHVAEIGHAPVVVATAIVEGAIVVEQDVPEVVLAGGHAVVDSTRALAHAVTEIVDPSPGEVPDPASVTPEPVGGNETKVKIADAPTG